ncbi:MAG: hypothetical protein WCC90_12950, partial [Methylocella sp.]
RQAQCNQLSRFGAMVYGERFVNDCQNLDNLGDVSARQRFFVFAPWAEFAQGTAQIRMFSCVSWRGSLPGRYDACVWKPPPTFLWS